MTKPTKPTIHITLTAQQLAFLDAMVGIYGSTRSEVVRFVFASWTTEHTAAISARLEQYKKWMEEKRGSVLDDTK